MMRSCRKSRVNSIGKMLNFMMFVEVVFVFGEERRRCSLLCCSEHTDGFVCVMSLFIVESWLIGLVLVGWSEHF